MNQKSCFKTIDCEYIEHAFAASYLRSENGDVAFIETNTTHAVPLLLKSLADEGYSTDQVRYIIPTHVHLDHAGGVSALLSHCKNATVLAHPRAAPHLIDPTKLVGSARAVYGEENFGKLYGEISPIDPNRVKVMEDGSSVDFGRGKFSFIHTRGHANHHFCVIDERAESVFTGDSYGLSYPVLNVGLSSPLFLVSTSPTDFLPDEAIKSIDRVFGLGLKNVAPTHFGVFENSRKIRDQLKAAVELSRECLNEGVSSSLSGAELEKKWIARLTEHYQAQARKLGQELSLAQLKILDLDLCLNAQGILFQALKQRQPK